MPSSLALSFNIATSFKIALQLKYWCAGRMMGSSVIFMFTQFNLLYASINWCPCPFYLILITLIRSCPELLQFMEKETLLQALLPLKTFWRYTVALTLLSVITALIEHFSNYYQAHRRNIYIKTLVTRFVAHVGFCYSVINWLYNNMDTVFIRFLNNSSFMLPILLKRLV